MLTAKQQNRMTDLSARLQVHGKLIERQVREMDEKDRALLIARVITVCAVVGQCITLYHWLVAPALQTLGCG